jgi:hypothetical protein
MKTLLIRGLLAGWFGLQYYQRNQNCADALRERKKEQFANWLHKLHVRAILPKG